MASLAPPDLIDYLRSLGLSDEEIEEYLRRLGLQKSTEPPQSAEIPLEGTLGPKETRSIADEFALSGREAAIVAGTVEPTPLELEQLDKKLAELERSYTEKESESAVDRYLKALGLTKQESETFKQAYPAKAAEPEIKEPETPRERREAIINELVKADVRPEDYEKVADLVSPQEFEDALTRLYAERSAPERPSPRTFAEAAKKLGLSGRETAVLAGTTEPLEGDLQSLAEKLGVRPEELFDPATGTVSMRTLSKAARERGLSSEDFEALVAGSSAPSDKEADRGLPGEFAAGFERGLLSVTEAGTKGLATLAGSRKLHRWAGELERAALAADEVLGSKADTIPEEVASAVGEFLGQVFPGVAAAALAKAAVGTTAAGAVGFGAASFLPNVGDAAETIEKRFGIEDPAVSLTAGFLMALLDTAAFSEGVGRLLGSEADEAAIKGLVSAVKAGKAGPASAVLEGFFRLLSGQTKGAAIEATTEVAQDLIAKTAGAISSGDWESFKERLAEEAADTFTKVALGTFFGTAAGAGFSVVDGFVQSSPSGGFSEGSRPEEEAREAERVIASMLKGAGLEVSAQPEGKEEGKAVQAEVEDAIGTEVVESEPVDQENASRAAELLRQGRKDEAAAVLFGELGADAVDETEPFPEQWVSSLLEAAQGAPQVGPETPAPEEEGEVFKLSERRTSAVPKGYLRSDLSAEMSGATALQSAQPRSQRVYGFETIELARPELEPPPGHEVVVLKMRTLSEAEGTKNGFKRLSGGVAWVSRVGEAVVMAVNPRLVSVVVAAAKDSAKGFKTIANDEEARLISGGVGIGVGQTLREALANGIMRQVRVAKRISIQDINPSGLDIGDFGLQPREVLFAAGELWRETHADAELQVPFMTEPQKDLLRFVNTRLNLRWVPLRTKKMLLGGFNVAIRSHSGPIELIVTTGQEHGPLVVAHEIGHSVVARLIESGYDVGQIAETILRTVPDLRDSILARGYWGRHIPEEALAESFAYLMANADDDTKARFLAEAPHPFVASVIEELADRVGEISGLREKGRHVPQGMYSKQFDAYHDVLVNIFARALAKLDRVGPRGEFTKVMHEITTPLSELPSEHRKEVLRFRRELEEPGSAEQGPPSPSSPEPEAGLKRYPRATEEELSTAEQEYAKIAAKSRSKDEKLAARIAQRVIRKLGYLSPTNPSLPLGLPVSVKAPKDFVAMVQAAVGVTKAGVDIGGHHWYERSMFDLAVGRLGYDWPLSEHDARRIAAVLAVTSPQTPVRSNVAITTVVINEADSGGSKGALGTARQFGLNVLHGNVRRAEELARSSSGEIASAMREMWSAEDSPRQFGRKVKSFYEALVRAAGHDPGTGSPAGEGFVADTWMAKAIGVSPDALPRTRAYDLVAQVFGEIASELGLSPDQAQAAYWVAARSAERALISQKRGGTEAGAIQGRLRRILEKGEFETSETWKEAWALAAELARRYPWTESYGEALAGVFSALVARAAGVDADHLKSLIRDAVRAAVPERIARLLDVHVSGEAVTVAVPLPLDRAALADIADAIESIAESIGGEVVVRAAVLGRGVPEAGSAVSFDERSATDFAKRALSRDGATPVVVLRGNVLASELRRAAIKAIETTPLLSMELAESGLSAQDVVHVSNGGELFAFIDDTAFSKKAKLEAFRALVNAVREVSGDEEKVAFAGSRVIDFGGEARRLGGPEADTGLLAEAGPISESETRARVSSPEQPGTPAASAVGAQGPQTATSVDDVVSMFGRAERLVAETAEKRELDAEQIASFESYTRALRSLLSDRFAPAFDALKKAFGADYARKLLDGLRYSSGPAEAVVIRFRQILDELMRAGVSLDEVGAWLFLRRIASEEYHWDEEEQTWVHGPGKGARGRATVENPLGIDKARATELLAQLEARLGPERLGALERALDRVLEIYDRVMGEVERSNGFPARAVSFMRENRFYVTFLFPHAIPDPIAEQPGAWPTGEVERQLGSKLDAVNPFFVTAAKLALLYQNAAKRRVQSEVIDALLELGVAKKAPESGAPGHEQVATLWRYEGDERVRYWVPRSVAESLNTAPALGYLVGKGLAFLNGVLRGAWVTYSPRFVFFNPVRDVRQTLMLLREVRTPADVLRFAKTWLSTFREVYSAEKKPGEFSESVVEAMELGVLGSGYLGSYAAFSGETEIATWSLGVLTGADKPPAVERWPIVGKAAAFLRLLGEVQEQTTKVAALRFLLSKKVPLDRAVDAVRNRAGTPNYRRAGRLGALLQFLLPFVNVRKEGYRALALAAKDDPGAFLVKTVIFGVIPAVMRWSLRTGLALALYKMFRPDDDDDEKAGVVMATKVMARATRGDFVNYDIVPLGLDADDKAVYLRLPLDHATQLVSGLTISVLDGALRKRGDFSSTFDLVSDSLAFAAGEIPSVHPLVQFVTDTTMVSLGFNPPDFWRGSYKVPRNVFEARDWRSLRYVAFKDLSGLLGPLGFSISRLPELGKSKTDPLSVIIKNPALDVTSGWVLRRTDAGLRDAVDRLIEQKRTEKARKVLAMDDLISRAVEEGRPIGWIFQEARKSGLIAPKSRSALMQQLRSIRSRYLEKKGLVYRKNYRHLTAEELRAVEDLLSELGEDLR